MYGEYQISRRKSLTAASRPPRVACTLVLRWLSAQKVLAAYTQADLQRALPAMVRAAVAIASSRRRGACFATVRRRWPRIAPCRPQRQPTAPLANRFLSFPPNNVRRGRCAAAGISPTHSGNQGNPRKCSRRQGILPIPITSVTLRQIAKPGEKRKSMRASA